jgi:hypothetical protein
MNPSEDKKDDEREVGECKFELMNVNWETLSLATEEDTNYSTKRHLPVEVQHMLVRAYNIDVPDIEMGLTHGVAHVNREGLAVFVWFDKSFLKKSRRVLEEKAPKNILKKVRDSGTCLLSSTWRKVHPRKEMRTVTL